MFMQWVATLSQAWWYMTYILFNEMGNYTSPAEVICLMSEDKSLAGVKEPEPVWSSPANYSLTNFPRLLRIAAPESPALPK